MALQLATPEGGKARVAFAHAAGRAQGSPSMPVASPSPCSVQCPPDAEYCVLAWRNDSLGARGRRLAFGVAAAVSLCLALAFVVAGAWPVLPWSLVEISALAAAFAWFERGARDWERLEVRGDRLIVERMSRGRCDRREWNRHWVRVRTDERHGGRGVRVVLQGAGEAWEVGTLLADDARREVGRELARLIGR